jgi:hypothetical protein
MSMPTPESPLSEELQVQNNSTAENIALAQERLAGLYHRIAPILRKEKEVTGVDEFYGFKLLDDLRDILKNLEKQCKD